MADETSLPAASPAVASKRASGSAAQKAKSKKPAHPPTAEMVKNAIKTLKERGGSSLRAIKKYVAANYKVDAEKTSPFIKKYLKTAVASGDLVQTKGKGAAGSFKLPTGGSSDGAVSAKKATTRGIAAGRPKTKTPASKKAAAPKSKKAVAEKKTAAAKSKKAPVAVEKKVVAAPKVAKTKSPSKAKKSTRGPTRKPKAPKPKKAVAVSKSARKAPSSPKKK